MSRLVDQQREMAPVISFVPGEGALPAYVLKLVNKSPSDIPQAFFQTAAPLLYLHEMFIVLSLLGQRLSFQGSPRAHLIDFLKFQVLSLANYKNLLNQTPLFLETNIMGTYLPCSCSPCLGYLVLGSVFFPSFCLWCSSLLWTVIQLHLALDHVYALSTLFDVVSSLQLAVKSLYCQSLGGSLGYLFLHGCYLVVSMG